MARQYSSDQVIEFLDLTGGNNRSDSDSFRETALPPWHMDWALALLHRLCL